MDIVRFKDLLDSQHTFPGDYTFKFIVGRPGLKDVLALFPDETPAIRPSAKSNYVGVTFVVRMETSDAVIAVYERARTIRHLIAL